MKRLFIVSLFLLATLPVNASVLLPKGILELKPYTAPDIQLSDLDGQPFSLKETKGHWVFVHFWASWCGPCRKELPAIQKMWDHLLSQGLKIALINTAEDEDTVFSFLSVLAPEIRPLMDRDGQVTEAWQPRGLPATYLVDPQGKVRYQALGGRPWDSEPYLTFLQHLIRSQTH